MAGFEWNQIRSADIRQALFKVADEQIVLMDNEMSSAGLDEGTREADIIAFLRETFTPQFAVRFAAHIGCISDRQADRICRQESWEIESSALVARAAIADVIMNRPVH